MDPKSRSFIGATASAIKAFALLLIKFINVLSNSVDMADKAVLAARERQFKELDLAQAEFDEKLERQVALRTVKDEEDLERFANADPDRARKMKEARASIRKILAKTQANLDASKDE